MVTPIPFGGENVDITPEREFASHLAYHLLDAAGTALVENRTGSIRLPKLDPEFGAIFGTSLGIITQAVRSDRLPRDFLADTQTPPTTAGDKNSPEDHDFEANETKEYQNE